MKYFLSQCDQKKSFDTEIKIFFRLWNFSWIKAQFRPRICCGKKIFLLLYLGKDKIVQFEKIFKITFVMFFQSILKFLALFLIKNHRAYKQSKR